MATGHAVHKSTDAGAPSLTNTAGSMIALLDYVLDVATGTHWEKVFTGTNVAVYRATTGERKYLRVDDSNAQVTRVTGYKTMSDVDTGTGQFPDPAVTNGYINWLKADSGNASPWFFVGDSRFFLLNVTPDITYDFIDFTFSFGEITPYDSLDIDTTILTGCNANQSGTNANANSWWTNSFEDTITVPGNNTNPGSFNISAVMSGTKDGLIDAVAVWGTSLGKSCNASLPGNSPANLDIAVMNPIVILSGDGGNSFSTAVPRGVLPYWYTSFFQIGGDIVRDNQLSLGAADFQIQTFCTSSSASDSNSCPYFYRATNDEPGRV